MAGTLCALLLAVVCCLTVFTSVSGEGGLCIYMKQCSDEYNERKSAAGNDRDLFCREYEAEMNCYHSVVMQCPEIQREFAQHQIKSREREQQMACDATSTMSSFVVVSAGVAAVFVLGRLF